MCLICVGMFGHKMVVHMMSIENSLEAGGERYFVCPGANYRRLFSVVVDGKVVVSFHLGDSGEGI